MAVSMLGITVTAVTDVIFPCWGLLSLLSLMSFSHVGDYCHCCHCSPAAVTAAPKLLSLPKHLITRWGSDSSDSKSLLLPTHSDSSACKHPLSLTRAQGKVSGIRSLTVTAVTAQMTKSMAVSMLGITVTAVTDQVAP